jgi:hypothetical protein
MVLTRNALSFLDIFSKFRNVFVIILIKKILYTKILHMGMIYPPTNYAYEACNISFRISISARTGPRRAQSV